VFARFRRVESHLQVFDIVLHKLFGEHSYLVSRALCRASGISGLTFLEHCYPLAMATRSAATMSVGGGGKGQKDD